MSKVSYFYLTYAILPTHYSLVNVQIICDNPIHVFHRKCSVSGIIRRSVLKFQCTVPVVAISHVISFSFINKLRLCRREFSVAKPQKHSNSYNYLWCKLWHKVDTTIEKDSFYSLLSDIFLHFSERYSPMGWHHRVVPQSLVADLINSVLDTLWNNQTI